MAHRWGGLFSVLFMMSGCNCDPQGGPDASTAQSLEWPPGATLEITATTATSAGLRWPEARGAVANYRLTWPGVTRDETGTTATLTGLSLGNHLPVEVVAVARDGTVTPPLRAEVAPAPKLDVPEGDISTDFCGSNAFLLQGSAQIPCELLSVVVGHVRTRDGVGVPGMRVSVLGHAEWGSTLSQADGQYALAVAAGRHTLDVRASSFLPIQRLATAKARDFTYLPDTVVLRRDAKVTAISVAAGGFHAATPQQDEDGARTTSVFIPAGTSAWLRLPDGGTQAVDALSLRATEATVGPSGPKAMPASLPPATAYTFAADISADEALAAGAMGVGFAAPVAIYADNFLHYPVGSAIPLGIYDEAVGRWESAPNAVVLQVTANGGVDITGDGVADSAFPLLAGEGATLAAQYPPGTQLVRSLTTHFSAMDTNACWHCIGSCEPAGDQEVNSVCESQTGGSLIRIQTRTLSEFVPVAGTGLSLGWHSNRGNVRKAAVDLRLGLLGDGGQPQGVIATYFRLEVAGRQYVVEHLDGGFGDAVQLAWDGKDAFGRAVKGPVAATSTTGYGFAGVSVMASSGASGATGIVDLTPNFGVWPPPGAVLLSSTREAAFYLKHSSRSLGDWVPRENLGNLSLDILHGYSEDGTLHLGNGSEVTAAESGAMVRHIAGGGTDFSEDAGAYDVNLGSGTAVLAEGPQGIFYVEKESRVRLLRPDGGVSTIAGDINLGFAGDGLPATQGRFNYARLLETDSAGNLYIGDVENYRIRRVDALTGVLSTVVGNGQRGFSPDGTLATDAKLDGLSDILFGQDGLLYFMAQDANGYTLRRVENGVLTTMAGGSTASAPPWEAQSPKAIAFRSGPHWLAQGLDGTIYVAGYDSGDARSDYVVRSIEADGRVRLLAGAGLSLDADEPEARNTCLSGLTGMAVARDGTLYVGESGGTGCGLRGPGVRAISPDGAFSLFFGGARAASSGLRPPDGLAALTQLNGVGDLVLRRNGSLAVVHRGPTTTLHEVALPLNANRIVPSRNGEEVYAFDARGRHLRTTSARTGLTLFTFAWGPLGLVSVTDVNGDVTMVERRGDGSAQALVAQDGQRTELSLNTTSGRVERITDAMGRFVEAAYFPTGLLSEWKDENGNATSFTWDDVGNLETHANALQAKKTFHHVLDGIGYTSPEGRLTQYLTEYGSGVTAQTTSRSDGTQSTSALGAGLRRYFPSNGAAIEVEMQAVLASRFGRAVDVPGKVVVRTPLGLESVTTSVRTSTNAPGDFLAVTEEVEETRVNGRLWRTRFDAAAKTFEVTSPEGRRAMATLDTKLRPLTFTKPGLLPITYTYDARGRLSTATQGIRNETYAYDDNGYPSSATNALNEMTTLAFDKTGRLQRATLANLNEANFSQDPVGNLSSVTPPDAGTHALIYDKADEATTYIPPAVTGVGNETTTFDLDGLVTRWGHADSSQTIITRETSGRVKQVTTPWWVNEFSYTTSSGQVETATRGSQRLDWKHDGFLVTEEKATGIASATSQWSYDSDFRRATHTIGGVAIAYAYDNDSLLVQAGAATLAHTLSTGQLAAVAVGSVRTVVTPNEYGELATLATTAGGTALYSEGLSYDSTGRIRVVEEVSQGVPVQWVYGYDKLGRLTSASKNGATATTWTYDGNGNRLTENGVGSTFDAQDRIRTRGTTTYEFDALGGRRLKNEGSAVTRYTHDGLAALTSVTLPDSTVVTYDYDARQRRVAKRRNGMVVKRWIYDGQYRVVAEVDGAGVVTSRFVYGSQSHSPDYLLRAGKTYAYVKNHLGSILMVVDSGSGEIAQRVEYDAWGSITANSLPDFQPFAFGGGLFDSDTALLHFGYRDYDPTTGAWTAKDPIRLSGGANALSYCRDDPQGCLDPDGLRPLNAAEYTHVADSISKIADVPSHAWVATELYALLADGKIETADGAVDWIMEIKGAAASTTTGGVIRIRDFYAPTGLDATLVHEYSHYNDLQCDGLSGLASDPDVEGDPKSRAYRAEDFYLDAKTLESIRRARRHLAPIGTPVSRP